MNSHAMKYDQMAERVLEQIHPDTPAARALRNSQDMILAAERRLVSAYAEFREGLRLAAADGNERAAEYLRRTLWDLT